MQNASMYLLKTQSVLSVINLLSTFRSDTIGWSLHYKEELEQKHPW